MRINPPGYNTTDCYTAHTGTASIRPPCRHGNGWFANVRSGIFKKRMFFCTDCDQALPAKELKEAVKR